MQSTRSTQTRFDAARLLAAVGLFLALTVPQSIPAMNSVTAQQQTPSTELSPQDVVRIQLEALRGNDAADHGIETCFRFASPTNQANTGPVSRFGQMIKEGAYSLMLDYEDAQYQSVEIVDRYARQKVTLVGASKIITYVFYLSKQSHTQCEGCWMTDSVAIEEVIEST